ncbi:plexin B1 [Homo sapiens]|uniref:Isoform 2 of Plexin-B1 n=1 Tax=Homo sapiens TaxID=9606 RepID=O43157-2|nr:plexin B1, isoform CRA_c [Homo sapiens]KAI2529409.1 plexin B1 [Homo sapiens]KAI4029473.1 plexin B1 [Homo sapiens]CAB56222.1 plexin-B1/SEP receptor [Homo sapiens]
MPALGPALLQALWAGWVLTLQPLPPTAFTPNGTYLQHLARDPTSGTLYLGATNFLFQLSPGLQLEATVSTGPVLDSRDCLPPVMPDECPQAQPTNNPNQLLLVSPGALVVCGSVHQGVCEQRRLGQLEQLLLRPERPGDTQYVAANDPAVSTVGLVAQGLAGEPLLFVGRGYTSRGVGGGIPPITTRALWPPDPQAAFSYEETAKLAVGRLSEYSHHFVSAFARGASAYFLFLRRDLQAQSRAFRAYVSRVCLRDQHYYSYVELPLACEGGRYGLIQAAAVATSREVAHGEVLFAAFSSAAPPTVGRPPSAAAGASGASALCAFPLDEVDRLANRTRDACYTREGRAEDGTEVAYIEYDVNSDCAQLPVDTLDAYPCGSDHTPSPMASRVPLEATPILEWPGIQLTAVAVTMEDGHTIAFLGDSQGQLHRVYLGPGSDGHPYSTQSIQQGSAVSRDLTFDGTFEHLYVMTQSTLLKVPVASCAQHLDCASCLAHRDPYCGWCVLLGRCSRRSECSRGQGPEQWLWSFQPELGCLQVAAMSPANISREETREVFLSVPDLPPLWPGESYSCHFGEHQSPALLTGSGVMCPSPDPSEAPVLPRGADYVSVSVELRFGAVVIAKTSLSFYDCVAVTELRPSAQCQACVSSRWGCNWCVWQHLCTHKASCDAGPMVASHQSPLVSPDPPARGDGDSAELEGPPAPLILPSSLDYQYDTPGLWELEEATLGASSCPCVESVQGSTLMPVHVEREIRLLGRNLHLFQDGPGDNECVMELEGLEVVVEARVECEPPPDTQCHVTCQQHQLSYEALQPELRVGLFLRRAGRLRVDSAEGLHVVLYDCSVGHGDCSRCQTAMPQYGCVWCEGERPRCVTREACGEAEAVATQCPAPLIHSVEPLTGPVDGGTRVTIRGSNLGQHVQDVLGMVTVAGVPCAVDAQEYEVSSSLVCITGASGEEVAGATAVEVPGRGRGVSEHDFAYQDPKVHSIFPARGPRAGGTRLTLNGSKLLTGRLEDIRVVVGDQPCHLLPEQQSEQLRCETSPRPTPATLPVAVWFGATERRLQRGQFKYTLDPNITSAGPTKSFLSGGREICVRGQNLDVVQTPRIRVTVVSRMLQPSQGLGRRRRVVPETACSLGPSCSSQQFEEPCHVNSSQLITCRTPALPGLPEDPWVRVEFILDNLVFDFATLNPTPFSYEADPTLQPLNPEDPTMPFRHKPGSVFSVEGENLDLAMSKEEVVAMIGDGPCVVKTLTRHHLYCEPPVEQPLPRHHALREAPDSLPEFTVQMGNLRFSLGHVQYDGESPGAFPVAAQVGLGVGTSLLALGVIIIVLMYRRKSKQALRDYKKVQIQLENLESSVRDRCKKEFTDLMTEMTDLTSDLLGSGIPFLDYKVYAERIFFPGHRESPLHRDLGVPESRRPTVEQGLGQLSNLLNSKLFLTKFIHTLESQRTFSARDRAYVASLLTVALHGKLEYFTDILRTLLSDLVAQYVAKNPKLMLRRTETVVEKLLTNWMSICLYTFVRDSVGEPLYMLFRGIKHQVDKGPVDSVTGKAKYTLNDNRLLREDVEYRPLTLNALLAVGPGAGEAQGVPVKVLDCDTISQAKEKMLDQLYKGVPLTQRPDPRTLDVEWRSGVAGHLILSDEDVTSEVQGLWRRLNTLQHYKVPDGATVALVPCLTKHVLRENQDYVPGERTPMLEDVDEGGIRPWHLVKPSDEPEPPRPRRGSLRGGERERAKAIPEIYLTRLLSMKGTLQKFVDDLFQVILSTSRPVPLAVKYFFDLLDEQAQQHGISDQDTIHIWKTNSLPLRFWINIIKNPQFVFDVQTSDNMDAVLLVIAQTFMDACTLADHKLGRDSPINKLLYARDIPRYKRMVERYYADIRQTVPASDQEMNSVLAELSWNYSGDLGARVALHELYKYINKYYDQIITALEEDGTAQKMQLGYRLQQIAAAVENKVTDL